MPGCVLFFYPSRAGCPPSERPENRSPTHPLPADDLAIVASPLKAEEIPRLIRDMLKQQVTPRCNPEYLRAPQRMVHANPGLSLEPDMSKRCPATVQSMRRQA